MLSIGADEPQVVWPSASVYLRLSSPNSTHVRLHHVLSYTSIIACAARALSVETRCGDLSSSQKYQKLSGARTIDV